MASLRELIGWHLGNVEPMTALDWEILQLVPPGSVLFLAGERVGRPEIERILEINPACQVWVRRYIDPRRFGDRNCPDYSCVTGYIDECRRTLDEWSWLPQRQRHFQFFNEPNMPRWSQWEGFGDTTEDMRRFNEQFCKVARALKSHDPTWPISWTPLTPGNRDVFFTSDPVGVPHYMHGPEAARDGATAQEIAQAVRSGPCAEALSLCDEFACHVYSHNQAWEPWNAPHGGLRFAQLARFLPRPMPIWITECLVTEGGGRNILGEQLCNWYCLLSHYPQVRGTMLWALGTQPGGLWYDGGRPRREVYMLKEMLESEPRAVPPAGESSPLPPTAGNEAVTATSPNQSDRQGHTVSYIVLHDTEGSREATLATIGNAAAGVSYHDVIDEGGTVYHAVQYDRAAWHCGGSHIDGVPDGKLNGTSYTNLVSIGVAMVYPPAPASPSWPVAQVRAAVLHVRELCRAYGIPRDGRHILRHGDIDPARRSDPRNLDWSWFLAQVAGEGPVGLSTGWPHDEPAAEPGLLQDKIRWWTEQAVREVEGGFAERGHAILLDLVDRERGLMYRLERLLKAG